MKVNEVTNPVIQTRLEMKKLEFRVDEQDAEIKKLRMSVLALQEGFKKLVNKLGPK